MLSHMPIPVFHWLEAWACSGEGECDWKSEWLGEMFEERDRFAPFWGWQSFHIGEWDGSAKVNLVVSSTVTAICRGCLRIKATICRLSVSGCMYC